MMRETSWLAGAWVSMSDGKPDPTWSLIGMVSKHRQPVPPIIGFVEPGYCVIMLHECDPEWFARAASGMCSLFRFEKPGLTLDWDAYADTECRPEFDEATRLRIYFGGRPRVIAADGRWLEHLSAYSPMVAAAMPT